jgi:hypothetical protein
VEPDKVNLWHAFPGTNIKVGSGGRIEMQGFLDVSSRLAMEISHAVQARGVSLPDPHYQIPCIDTRATGDDTAQVNP